MTTRRIRNEDDLTLLFRYLKARKRPFRVEITDGRSRSIEQNSLQHLWIKEAAEQLGDRTTEELRAEMKLRFGVPILRAENDRFREVYDRTLKRLPYEQKLELIQVMDIPVTRLMSVEQKTTYLDQMSQHFLEQGIVLTEPKAKEAA